MAAPLTYLLKKDVTFEWGPAQHTAFMKIKQNIADAICLKMPIDGGAFIIECDASDMGIGAVLKQTQKGVEEVLSFGSKKFNPGCAHRPSIPPMDARRLGYESLPVVVIPIQVTYRRGGRRS
eukprot:GHVS01089243.1.p4 GENE.GHVS01089243.1~~GHVS01089243.1.p4  ORF type:complete len:122 (+),score=18.39 GHVS01089243.1:432-797(+)